MPMEQKFFWDAKFTYTRIPLLGFAALFSLSLITKMYLDKLFSAPHFILCIQLWLHGGATEIILTT